MGWFSEDAPEPKPSWDSLGLTSLPWKFTSPPTPTRASLFGLEPLSNNGWWKSRKVAPESQEWYLALLANFGISGTVGLVLGFVLCLIILKLGQKTISPPFNKIPFFGKRLSAKPPKMLVPRGTQAALKSIKGTAPGIITRINPLNWRIFNLQKIAEEEDDEKYQAGEPYGDPSVMATGIVKDLKSVGLKAGMKDLQTLLKVVQAKGKPVNDREMTMEKMIAITSALPRNSKTRKKLSGIIIDSLWQSLQHPPLSYLGNKFQYRTPDGSYNNPLQPDLGKAGSPYARTVPKLKHLHGVQPDPGLLFDLLMGRTDDTFKENPAGISSVLFYHASIIIHDVFRTNRFDPNISDTSSYLDLAPLYGSSRADQESIRTMQGGMLKPDTFAERRLLGLPPGINVMLVMYSRFHNYVADVLLKINENGRFTLPPTRTEEAKQRALTKQDEDLFQTARLVTNGLYINICLHDYLRGLTNTHHSASDWTLDPRVAVERHFDPDGVPRGVGNQVSAEFNLLYRFHSTISQRDEKWMNTFLRSLFPGDKPLEQLTPQEFIQGLFRFEQNIPEDPSKREFSGLKRDEHGRFNDGDLARIMKESMEDPAGLFGARMVPKALRIIEVTGILTARKWQLASLNEMRDFFKLKRHDTFEDINPDPEIADLLRKLYDHPDMVEMYPGMFLEDAKPRMDPGCGGCPPYTVGRAVFSDAITLVRSDRFCTVDYTASNLTSWGFQEVQQNLDIMGGSMFHKLFQRALPGWFPYNSLHTTQPMFTRKMNEEIAREIGTIDQFSLADPAPPPAPVVVTKHSTVTKVLKDQISFRVPWIKWLNDIVPGRKFNSSMLAGDLPINTAQKNMITDIMFSPAEFMQLFSATAISAGRDLIDRQTLNLKKSLDQIDIVRDVAIPLNTRLLADLFALDLKTRENKGGSLSSSMLYKHLVDVRTFVFNNNDPALALQRRDAAREGIEALTETGLKAISGNSRSLLSRIPLSGWLFGSKQIPRSKPTVGSLRWYGQNVMREIIAAGKTPEEAVDIGWLTAVGGVGAPIGVFVDVLQFFLKEDNSHHWEAIQGLVSHSDSESADSTLRQYVLEAQRLTSSQRNLRICASETTIDGKTFKPGDAVVSLLGQACMDPETVLHPHKFKLDRPANAYIHYGYGAHECIGREITLAFVVTLVKLCAGLKNLRPAPGDMGVLKQITLGTERCYLNDSWSHLTFDPTTWKLHFEGRGKGVYKPLKTPVTAGRDLNALSNSLIQQQKDFLQAAVKITNGGGTAHTLKDEVHPVADETNGELDEATDLEGDSNSVIHQIIPVFEDEHHGAANTVHEVSFSSFSHSYERDHDRDLSYGLTRGQ